MSARITDLPSRASSFPARRRAGPAGDPAAGPEPHPEPGRGRPGLPARQRRLPGGRPARGPPRRPDAPAPRPGLRGCYPANPRPRPHPRRPALTWRTARAELAEGIRQVAGTRLLLTLLVFQIALNLGLGADKLLIFLLRSTLALSPWHVGLVIST